MKTKYMVQGSVDGKDWKDLVFKQPSPSYHVVMGVFKALKDQDHDSEHWKLYTQYRVISREIRESVLDKWPK